MTMGPPFLSDAEIADLCTPLSQPAAQVRHLRRLGLTVTVKPNGRPVVIRSHAEAVLSGEGAEAAARALATAQQQQPGPNRGALIELFRRGGSDGSPPRVQPT